MKKDNTISEGTKRVSVCSETKKKILQVWTGKKWLCLHNDNELLDKMGVEAFEAGYC